jgi:hypothetical protein
MMTRQQTTLVAVTVLVAAAAVWTTRGLWTSRSGQLSDTTDVAGAEPADGAAARGGNGVAVEAAMIDVRPRAMPRIEAGTVIGEQAPLGWTHLVLHAVPRVAEGDVEKVSSTVASLASSFHLTVLARVDRRPGETPPRYELRNVAIGLAMNISGKEVIVTSDSQKALGAGLNFMDRRALAENEASLDRARQVARTPTMLVFDAAAVMWLEGDHRPAVHRHAVLVSPADGRLAALVWLLVPATDVEYRLCGDSVEWLPAGLHEDRALHVDADKFVLGLPTKEAFALVRLPQGKDVPLTPALRQFGPSRFHSPRDAAALEAALGEAIGWSEPHDPHGEK